MNADASVGALYEALHEKLDLSWVTPLGSGREIQAPDPDRDEPALVGHLNLIHPNRVQVLGAIETGYLDGLDPKSREHLVRQLFDGRTDLIVIGGGQPVPADIRRHAEASATPLLASPQPTRRLVAYLDHYLTHLFAEKVTLHGVFMEVFSLGVLITGAASVGKSELALELVSRGHRLVADDATVFARTAPDVLTGRCPEMLRDYLEVRGLGILNIRAMFGDSAIKYSRNLRLILKLVAMSEDEIRAIDRLHGARSTRTILGVEIPEITLPVAPGRNLAVLAEGAARNHVLYLKGFDASRMFVERQARFMDNEDP